MPAKARLERAEPTIGCIVPAEVDCEPRRWRCRDARAGVLATCTSITDLDWPLPGAPAPLQPGLDVCCAQTAAVSLSAAAETHQQPSQPSAGR